MEPPRARSSAWSVTVVAVAMLAVVVAAAIGVVTIWPRFDPYEWQIASEIDAARADGLLDEPAPAPPEPPSLAAAREDLERWIERSLPSSIRTPYAFGSAGALDSDAPPAVEVVRAELERYRDVLDGFAALPDELWLHAAPRRTFDEYASPRRPSERLYDAIWAANLLAMRAWLAAHDAGDSREAGRWIARLLAMARVTDRGDGLQLHVRMALVECSLRRAERLVITGAVDPAVFGATLREELARWDLDDRRLKAYWRHQLFGEELGQAVRLDATVDIGFAEPGDLLRRVRAIAAELRGQRLRPDPALPGLDPSTLENEVEALRVRLERLVEPAQ